MSTKPKLAEADKKPKQAGGKLEVRGAVFTVLKFLFGFGTSILIIGYIAFIAHALTIKPPTNVPKVDGIVVLTGANGQRLTTGAELLKQGYGERLLISGVNQKIKPEQIQTLLKLDDASFNCCVDLDYVSKNTYENGLETANWARALGYEKILLVTSSYHMARSKIEISAAMDDIEIIAFPVRIKPDPDASWWGGWERIKLLTREYGKLLVSIAREPGARPKVKQPISAVDTTEQTDE